eukprot:CAMPEP_0113690416 /NCGR_PEP_ID=MMETSP0038_2-20120614/17774_1 /TAXON_ID=2898 /ORGANISM="Cryptomonas paramecium" /LENGTH=113 /DNA_ID=CAMNT_0000611729 /DNA_START=191 /DNA_END=529 /DNA_ORIENTATION=+ /assembly_acc=CAM_ASM_000170
MSKDPPDVVFEEGSEPFIEYDQITALREWDLQKPTALKDLMMELRERYRLDQLRRCMKDTDDRTRFELESLAALCPDSLEVRQLVTRDVECVVPLLLPHDPGSPRAAPSQEAG